MRHPDLPKTCDLTELIAANGGRGFRVAFDNHPCPDAWTEAFATDQARLVKAHHRRSVSLTKAARVVAGLTEPQPKVTRLMAHRYEPVRKDHDPLKLARQILANLKQRDASRDEPSAGTHSAATAQPPAASGEDKTALARQHLAGLAAASAARVGNQHSGMTIVPGSSTEKLRDGGGSTLAQVISRASHNVPRSGGVRWKGGD